MTEPRYGYMCGTAHDDELGSSRVEVYPSERALRADRGCVDQCGVFRVKIELVEVIQEGDMLDDI